MPISRFYHNADQATSAVDELKQVHFNVAGTHVFNPGSGDATAESIAATGISKVQAKKYVARVSAGETLVVVNAPFGTAAWVTEILDRAGPGEEAATESASVYEEFITRDNAALLSSAFDIPVLSHNPTPLSSWINWRTLSADQRASSNSHGFRTLWDNPTPLSSKIGMKVLSHVAAPFSALIGQKTLWSKAAPLSEKVNFKPLHDEPAPLSARIGFKTLLSSPTPLSDLLGLPVLTKKQ